MANSRIYLKSEAGGTTTLSRDTSAASGNLVLPAGGNVASVDTAVTDNAIARFDSTTGKLQNSGVIIDDNGNVGIGTGSPIDKLTMYSASGNLFSRSQSGTSTLLTGVYSDGTTCVNSLGNYPLILLTNNAERMRIDTNGNVGIGTGSNINAKLDVLGSFRQYNPGTSANSVVNHVNDAKNWYVGLRGDSSNAYSIADETRQRLLLDVAGNTLHLSPNGGLGYGTGAGGTVTQLTSKSTPVTLNKPSGVIIMNNSALAAGTYVEFGVSNSIITSNDTVKLSLQDGFVGYRVEDRNVGPGGVAIRLTNITGGSLSQAVVINFIVIKGAIS